MSILFKNTWGTPESGVDQQRADMFRVSVNLPPQLREADGVGVWDKHIEWAVETFPFPERDTEAIPIKHGQQTRYQIGADVARQAITMVVRYAFNQRTAVLLERWRHLISNPRTGGHAITSKVKTNGIFYWLAPNTFVLGDETATEREAYTLIRAYELHGCWLKNLKPSEANRTATNVLVTYEFTMQIDDYYPAEPLVEAKLRDLVVPTAPALVEA